MQLLLLLFVLASCKPVIEFSLKRDAQPNELVRFTLALKQRNVELFKSHVMELSNPNSPKFANWMSRTEIDAFISPLPSQKKALKVALLARDIRVVADNGDHLVVEASANAVEHVFSTNVTVYAHARTKRELFKCDAYSIPRALSSIVEFLVGLPELPLRSSVHPKRRSAKSLATSTDGRKKKKEGLELTNLFFKVIIPGFLRDLYKIPLGQVSPSSSLALVEFLDCEIFSFLFLFLFAEKCVDRCFLRQWRTCDDVEGD